MASQAPTGLRTPPFQRQNRMIILKFFSIIVALLIAGWLVLDGARALITGDYRTPRAGPRAGQLGPWARLVSAAGLNPRSRIIKAAHVLLGVGWLAALVCFSIRPSIGWWTLLASAACTLWYLPIGTLLSLVELAILLSPSIRALK